MKMYVCEVQTIREINCRTYIRFNGSLSPIWKENIVIKYHSWQLPNNGITYGYTYSVEVDASTLGFSKIISASHVDGGIYGDNNHTEVINNGQAVRCWGNGGPQGTVGNYTTTILVKGIPL